MHLLHLGSESMESTADRNEKIETTADVQEQPSSTGRDNYVLEEPLTPQASTATTESHTAADASIHKLPIENLSDPPQSSEEEHQQSAVIPEPQVKSVAK